MRHDFRLNRVGCGIPGQLRPKVWTLPEQPSSRAPVSVYCTAIDREAIAGKPIGEITGDHAPGRDGQQ